MKKNLDESDPEKLVYYHPSCAPSNTAFFY